MHARKQNTITALSAVSTFTSVCECARRPVYLRHLWRVCASVCANVCTILDGIWARHCMRVRVRPASKRAGNKLHLQNADTAHGADRVACVGWCDLSGFVGA